MPDPGFPLCQAHRLGVELAQKKIQPRQIRDAGSRSIHLREDEVSNCSGVGKMEVVQKVEPHAQVATKNAGDGDIDAIGRGAAHHAGNDHPSATASSAGVREPVTLWAKSTISCRSCSTSNRVGTMEG